MPCCAFGLCDDLEDWWTSLGHRWRAYGCQRCVPLTTCRRIPASAGLLVPPHPDFVRDVDRDIRLAFHPAARTAVGGRGTRFRQVPVSTKYRPRWTRPLAQFTAASATVAWVWPAMTKRTEPS
jgi:hypothetical protein